ncbi:MAG: energy transducer TonB [Thiomicrorhabdus sp.]|nr:energy transducer TonB [Thiomicrorhabdus sp.]
MKSQTALSFIIAAIIYSLILLSGYWLWMSDIIKVETPPKLTQVPVTLEMFAEPTPTITPPVVQPTVEPINKPVVEKTAEPTPVVEPKAPPVKKEIKKEIKKEPEKKPIEKPEKIVKKQPPIKEKKVNPKPVKETVQPVKEVVKTTNTKPLTPVKEVKVAKPIAPTYSAQQVADAEQRYLYALRKQIVTYAQDTYPRRAKRRHWEGEVMIEFNLTPNGKITRLKIIESSGRSILDQAALEIFQIKMAYHFKPFPKEIDRTSWVIKVPVSYSVK